METSSLSQLKKELQTLPHPQLVELCTRLAKYKKENKELLHYLLFETHDEQQYISQVKEETAELFKEVNTHPYYAKKTIRKILRGINKRIKYSGQPQTAVELLIDFCRQLKNLGKVIYGSTQLMNLYEAQLKKIEANMKKLHEDIQYDYRREIDEL